MQLWPGATPAQFDRAMAAFAGVVGREWVLATDEDRATYIDSYAPGDGLNHAASAAVAPATAEEAQAIIRLANELRVPLWPVSRGKNLGYGGASPAMAGSVVLDLGRMRRIIDVDVKFANCLLEPGVGFYDLYDHLADNDLPLWLSTPGNGWGSVVGNALERGLGYTPYGDHASKICGMEVILPAGNVIRTGMGGMEGNKAWQSYQHGFGPSWDQMFVQSSLGVVTKMGMWLQPEPEMSSATQVELPQFDDIGWCIDALRELRVHGIIEHPFVFGNFMHDAAVVSTREEWYDGPGALPEAVVEKIMAKHNVGWWRFGLSLHGHASVVEAKRQIVNAALEPRLPRKLVWNDWTKGMPREKSAARPPSALALQIVNWRGGRGGHIGFSPVMPPDGALALKQARAMKKRFEEFGLDYYTSFTMGHRHINNVNLILYNRDDEDMVDRARRLFATLIEDCRKSGYGEYRTHIEFMDPVAKSFDFNNNAMLRLNELVKDAVDPNGILAPGKNGIWPAAWRKGK